MSRVHKNYTKLGIIKKKTNLLSKVSWFVGDRSRQPDSGSRRSPPVRGLYGQLTCNRPEKHECQSLSLDARLTPLQLVTHFAGQRAERGGAAGWTGWCRRESVLRHSSPPGSRNFYDEPLGCDGSAQPRWSGAGPGSTSEGSLEGWGARQEMAGAQAEEQRQGHGPCISKTRSVMARTYRTVHAVRRVQREQGGAG